MRCLRLISSFAILLSLASCSTVKILPEGSSRLTSNKITVTNDKKFSTNSLTPYIKQKAKGWSMGLCIYNWEDGKGKGWDNFVHKLGTAPVVYDSTLVEPSVENIVNHLEYIGYYNSRVEPSVLPKGKKKVSVHYSVTLGKRYPITEINYEVPADEGFAEDFYADTVNVSVKKGDFLSASALDAESVRECSVLRNKGYYDFAKNFYFFQADTISDPGRAKVNIIVKNTSRNDPDGPEIHFSKYRIGSVNINYPVDLKIRPKILTDLNIIKSGDLYSETIVKKTYNRYSSVNIINSVNIQTQGTDDKLVNCDINLQKSKLQGFKVGLEASVNSTGLFGISPEISYYNRNIFRGGEVFNLSLTSNHQISFKDSNVKSNEVSVNASLLIPRFLPFPTRMIQGQNIPKTAVKIAYNYQNRPEYIRNMVSFTYGYTNTTANKHLQYQVSPIAIKYVRLPYMSEEFAKSIEHNMFLKDAYSDHMDAGLTSTIYYSSSPEVNPKVSYWYTRFAFDISGNLLSAFYPLMKTNENGQGLILGIPFAQYVRGELTLGSTWAWGEKFRQAFATRFLLGLGHAYGNSLALPFEKQFYAGGANSMRGWTARTLGPGTSPLDTYWTIPNQTGDMKLEANVEYRFKIVWKLDGALFMDAGNIWYIPTSEIKELDPTSQEMSDAGFFSFKHFGESLGWDWGLGIRLDMNFLVLRLDWGMRIHDPARTGSKWVPAADWFKDSYALHFGVGYPF